MNAIVITYKSKVWTPTLRSRSKWKVVSWKLSAGFRMVRLENVETGKRISVGEDIIKKSFSASRKLAAIFAPELQEA